MSFLDWGGTKRVKRWSKTLICKAHRNQWSDHLNWGENRTNRRRSITGYKKLINELHPQIEAASLLRLWSFSSPRVKRNEALLVAAVANGLFMVQVNDQPAWLLLQEFDRTDNKTRRWMVTCVFWARRPSEKCKTCYCSQPERRRKKITVTHLSALTVRSFDFYLLRFMEPVLPSKHNRAEKNLICFCCLENW